VAARLDRKHTVAMSSVSSIAAVAPARLRRLTAAVVLASVAALSVAETASPSGPGDGKDGRQEVRVAGTCSAGGTSKLRLRSRDGGIELEFEVDHNRAGRPWRVAIIHERRVTWRGVAKPTGPDGSLVLERRLPDLVGSDTVTARAWGPAGVTCQAAATIPGR